MDKAKLDVTREVRTFWDLNNASYVMNEKTKENREGSYYTIMASLVFSAFCFEAYLNHLGNLKIDFWEAVERNKVMQKYSILCKTFNVEPDWGKRPYQTLRDIFRFRNSLAHGKSKVLKNSRIVEADAKFYDHRPLTDWEEYCTEANAEKAHEDIQTIISELSLAAGEEEFPFFSSGMTHGSMEYSR